MIKATMETLHIDLKEKIKAFWKIYNHTCLLMSSEELIPFEKTTIDLMIELGFTFTEGEREYLMNSPDRYFRSIDWMNEYEEL